MELIKIGALREAFASASESRVRELIALYEKDEREGVQKLLESQRKKLEKLSAERERLEKMRVYEHQYRHLGLVCGIDEAGRGPLAGPVCAAAVILPKETVIEGLNDSKKLSEKKREQLYDVICETAVSYAISFATVAEIEELNILHATQLAMIRAINELDPVPDLALIDGNQAGDIKFPHETVIKGDASCVSIAAASILAKVTRDRFMVEMAEQYPNYHFEKHKGYGTKDHYNALREFGPCPIHRPSFLKKIH